MAKCMRCEGDFDSRFALDRICVPCLDKDPYMTAEERSAMNLWDNLADFLKVWQAKGAIEWHWARNTTCKYIELRIDMRDGGCIIRDREGNRITPEALAWQYSEKNPERPK